MPFWGGNMPGWFGYLYGIEKTQKNRGEALAICPGFRYNILNEVGSYYAPSAGMMDARGHSFFFEQEYRLRKAGCIV